MNARKLIDVKIFESIIIKRDQKIVNEIIIFIYKIYIINNSNNFQSIFDFFNF